MEQEDDDRGSSSTREKANFEQQLHALVDLGAHLCEGGLGPVHFRSTLLATFFFHLGSLFYMYCFCKHSRRSSGRLVSSNSTMCSIYMD